LFFYNSEVVSSQSVVQALRAEIGIGAQQGLGGLVELWQRESSSAQPAHPTWSAESWEIAAESEKCREDK